MGYHSIIVIKNVNEIEEIWYMKELHDIGYPMMEGTIVEIIEKFGFNKLFDELYEILGDNNRYLRRIVEKDLIYYVADAFYIIDKNIGKENHYMDIWKVKLGHYQDVHNLDDLGITCVQYVTMYQ